ncbi:MAG: hypothetical protein CYPHOPRED_002717 [Cyphobasidiales sp. Tagirdzhanova-0007]|nr:MAG: hypothetical protein CYPHOPRED_002717 [Cyphobasidiales sp. Tagirdzhanova-0007]
MNSPITVFEELPENPRLTNIKQAFEARYGRKPDFIARAPGRVSIIGGSLQLSRTLKKLRLLTLRE